MGVFFCRPQGYLSFRSTGFAEVRRVVVPHAPGFLHGRKFAFLTDIHLRPSFSDRALSRLLDAIDGLLPDLLLLGGDYGEGPAQERRFFAALESRRYPLGAFGCIGNNDREAFPGGGLLELAGSCGARILINEAVCLALGGGTLKIAGIDEYKYGSPRAEGLFQASAGERGALPDGAYRLLLSHYPVLPDYRGTPAADLQLSGHTHGGQVNVLGVTPYTVGYDRGRWNCISGERRFGATDLVVCNGIGMSGVNLRLGARPQILLIEFSP